MAELSQLLAKEEEIVHKGKKYPLAPLLFEVQAAYEQWLENRAWDALRRQRPRMSPIEYQEQCDILHRAVAADKYGWFSDAAQDSLGGLYGVGGTQLSKGARQLLLIRLQEGQKSLNGDGVQIDEAIVQEIVEVHLEEVMTLMRKMDFDPNSQSPASPGDPGSSNPSSPTAPTSSA